MSNGNIFLIIQAQVPCRRSPDNRSLTSVEEMTMKTRVQELARTFREAVLKSSEDPDNLSFSQLDLKQQMSREVDKDFI